MQNYLCLCLNACYFGSNCFEFDQIKVYYVKFRGSARNDQKLMEYINSTKGFTPLTFRGSARDALKAQKAEKLGNASNFFLDMISPLLEERDPQAYSDN